MSLTNGLVNTLNEWDETCKSQHDELKGIVSIALLQLGGREDFKSENYKNENCLDYLSNRIYTLEKQGIFEEFLVYGVLNILDDYFANQINNHGVFLINNEDLHEKSLKMGIEEFTADTKNKIEYYRSRQYIYDKENELDTWNLVKSKNFSKSNIRKWELEKNLQASKDYKAGLNPEELKEMEEMIAKLKKNK